MFKWRIFVLCLCIATGLMLAFACTKSYTYTWMYYDETYCNDPWRYSSNDETLKNNFAAYYKSRGVTVYESEIFIDRTPESNNDCAHKTGRRFKCKITQDHVNDMKSFGLYQ